MTLNIKLKRSGTAGSAPTASQLENGELGLNYNADTLALYCKDTDGAIRQIAGKGGEGSYWDLSGSILSPEDNSYNVNIGNAKIELNADGTGIFKGSGGIETPQILVGGKVTIANRSITSDAFLTLEAGGTGSLSFKGKNSNSDYPFFQNNGSIKGTFRFKNLTENRTYTYPDKGGTVALTADIPAVDGNYVKLAGPTSPNSPQQITGAGGLFVEGGVYVGGTVSTSTFELWKSTLTEEQLEELEAGTLIAPADVSNPGDGSYARQWWYGQQSEEDQALIDAGELDYPEKLQAANFQDVFAVGDNTNLNLLSTGKIQAKNTVEITRTGSNNTAFQIARATDTAPRFVINASGVITTTGAINVGTADSPSNTVLDTGGNITSTGLYNDASIKKLGDNNFKLGSLSTLQSIEAGTTSVIGIGQNACKNLKTGSGCIGIGTNALQKADDGGNNIAIGGSALSKNVSGTRNICIGPSAGLEVIGGSNTIIGRIAGDATLSQTIILGAGLQERARCDSNGNWTFSSEEGVPSAIKVSSVGFGDPGGNITSKTLDDYEEGTFTPTLRTSDGQLEVTYDTANTGGIYVKVGTLVSLSGRIKLLSTNGLGDNLQIKGIPYASSNSTFLRVSTLVSVSSAWGTPPFSNSIATGKSVILIKAEDGTIFTGAETTATSSLYFSMTYIAKE